VEKHGQTGGQLLTDFNSRPGSLFHAAQSKSRNSAKGTSGRGAALVGYGKSFSSFGEIVQGRLTNGEDFLVTMPIDLWSTCELVCRPIAGPLIVECDLEKSRSVLQIVLEELGIGSGFHIECQFTRNIPVGKGLSSSTADMLAALRAIQEVFGLLLTENFISRIFAAIEPHDGVHYNCCVAYNHRKGVLLANYGHIPDFMIVAVDAGGAVDTIKFNRSVAFSEAQKKDFDRLFADLNSAFLSKNDTAIAECATQSARLFVERAHHPVIQGALEACDEFQALGIVATHSGTCAGFLFPGTTPAREINRLTADIAARFDKDVFAVRTLTILS
jgi:L-threonine kinase